MIGNGVLGLWALQGKIADPDGSLAAHYRLPTPRLGLKLHGVVSAAMDISDGLLQDSGHVARASGVAIQIDVSRVPLSPAGRAVRPDFVASGIAGGDDYELLLAAPAANEAQLRAAAQDAGVTVTKIGRCLGGEPAVTCVDGDGTLIPAGGGGWSHF
jgi:thiamine-monophosphate kinase